MELLTAELEKRFARLYETENDPNPIVLAKFFTPDSDWTWYATEYDPETRTFFGLVVGFEIELGYFSLDELEAARGPLGLPIERDLLFTPTRLSEVKKLHYC